MANNLLRVMTRDEAVSYFENQIMPDILMIEAQQTGSPDWPRRSEAWNNWTDSLCKNRQISDWQYMNWSHPPSTG